MNRLDVTCDLNCPGSYSAGWCCKKCHKNCKDYKNKTNEHLWDEKEGFHSPTGCRLSRDRMPDRCKEYNCKNYTFTIKRAWVSGNQNTWVDRIVNEELGLVSWYEPENRNSSGD